MSDLKESVKEIMNDLASNEVAILEKTDIDKARLILYAKVELAGDTLSQDFLATVLTQTD